MRRWSVKDRKLADDARGIFTLRLTRQAADSTSSSAVPGGWKIDFTGRREDKPLLGWRRNQGVIRISLKLMAAMAQGELDSELFYN